jgi:hypothetical protein
MKTSFVESNAGWFSRQASRAAFTSSRPCSAAKSVFFESNAVTGEKSPQAGHAFRETVGVPQLGSDLLQRRVRLSRDLRQEPIFVCFNGPGLMVAAGRTRGTTAGFRDALHPTDGCADADPKDTGGSAARSAGFQGVHHALTQIMGIGGWHGVLPVE